MLIDMHVHTFSEKIAAKALSALSGYSGLTPLTDGTVRDTVAHMDMWGVDKAAALSIATKPSQQSIITEYSKSIKSERLLPFGSVHPDSEDINDELVRISQSGLYGVKLHPDYQGFKIDEKRVYDMYDAISQLGLPVLFHSGFDWYSPDVIHCTPEKILKVRAAFPHMKMILAHLGANRMWQQVYDEIAGIGGETYLDTAFTLECDNEIMEKIINRHGADRVLFASDCPWASPGDIKRKIESLGISDDDKEKIFSLNAERLLGI